jgi:hypothetical protein
MTETLRQKQSRFVRCVALLIQYAGQQGYEFTFGEAWRTPEQAKWNAERGKGTATSLHIDRLAIDFNLFRNGKWLTKTEDHKPLGEYWESLAPDCRWGGRFGDGNHYSIAHNGRM